MKTSISPLKIFAGLVTVAATLMSPTLLAHKGGKHLKCEAMLNGKEPGPMQLISSERDDDVFPDLQEAAKVITDIAHRLGLATPHHQLNFVPSDQLNVMATTGGHAAPHWTDGAQIVGSLGSSMGVLEFVTPGCPTCRSFYSDSTSLIHQISVIMHVMGHNDMGMTSNIINLRQSDAPAATLELARYMEMLYTQYDQDQVALFYQYLKSLLGLQDFAYGSYQPAETFDPNKNLYPERTQHVGPDLARVAGQDPPKNAYDTRDRRGWSSTASVLQAFIRNLPPEAPQWQRELTEKFEAAVRVYPSIFQTKIMNEGWATLMQYIIARHSPWVTSKDSVEFGQLLSGVAHKSLSNPYWMGLTGWFNLYKKYVKRPEIKDLPPFEQDKAFIAWARKKYAGLSDYEWVKMALDRDWVEDNKFFLFRQTQYNEMDPSRPPEKQKYIALSRDPGRIQRYILRRLVDKTLKVPNIHLQNLNRQPHRVNLVHRPVEDIPLEPVSAAKTLFVISQIMQKPVSLTTLGGEYWVPAKSHPPVMDEEQMQNAWNAMPPGMYGPIHAPQPPRALPVRFEVTPEGDIKVYRIDENEETLLPDASMQFKAAVHVWREDILQSYNGDLASYERKKWTDMIAQAADKTVDNTKSIVNYAPTAAHALEEYIRVVEARLENSLRQAVRGQRKMTPSKNGARISVLPEIPEFRLDQRFIAMKKQVLAPAPVDPTLGSSDPDLAFDSDDGAVALAPGHYLPGDTFPGPEQQKGQGEGEGEGEGDGDEGEGEGDPQDGDITKPGQDPSQGSGGGDGDPHEIEVPLELIGEMLQEELQLPNIRRTQGKEPDIVRARLGGVKKPNGILMWDRIAVEAMNKAMAVRKQQGQDWQNVLPEVLIREGLKMIDPSDFHVVAYKEKPRPDFDAVLVVNVDLTGSMAGEPIAIAKNLVFNIRALLKAKYKNVIIRYVGFETTAKEYSEEKIWKAFGGGGTAYRPPLEKTEEILNEYPDSKYNKYALLIGDAQTGDVADTVAKLEEMTEYLQYFGLAVTGNPEWGRELSGAMRDYQSTWPWVGVTELQTRQDIPRGLQELFPKGAPEEP